MQPETLGGWIGAAVGITILLSFLAGLVTWILLPRLRDFIEGTVEDMVGKDVASATDQLLILAEVKTLSLNMESQSEQLAVVQRLEVQINNGLRDDVDFLKTHARETAITLSSIKAHIEEHHIHPT